YTHPTAAELAAFLDRSGRTVRGNHSLPPSGRRKASATEINAWVARVVRERFTCRPVQEIEVSPLTRWFLRSTWPGKPSLSALTLAYLRINFALDTSLFDRAVQDTLAEHSLLRASLRAQSGERFTFVEHSFDDLSVPFLDISSYS